MNVYETHEMMTSAASMTAHKNGTHLNIASKYQDEYLGMNDRSSRSDLRRHFKPGRIIDRAECEPDDGRHDHRAR